MFLFGLFVILIGGIVIFRAEPTSHSLSASICSPFLKTDSASQDAAPFIVQGEQKKESPDLGLVQGNCLVAASPPSIVSGQVLATLSEIETEFEAPQRIFEYTVEARDCPESIAENFGITLNTLLWANDLTKNSVIQPGQKLLILPVSGIMHLVATGETLTEIAKDYKGNVDEIISFNKLSKDGKIFAGDILIIPDGVMPQRKTPYYAEIPLTDSYFIFPTAGRISQGLHWYNAIDVANKCGTSIYAAAGGVVQKAGYIRVGGNRVRILHSNGVVTYYGHLSKIIVSPGERVSQGEVIGYMGRTGLATGCHLHFDVLTSGVKNPLAKYPVGSYIKF